MMTVDCPLCDAPARYEDVPGTLECPACDITLEIAETPVSPDLAAAA
jgi:uncharacterized Zn finger protein (UPF0148 family)